MAALISSITSGGIANSSDNDSACDADIRVYALGATAFTRMPCAGPSVARFRVNPKTAPLAEP
jgi:hypothetical protein